MLAKIVELRPTGEIFRPRRHMAFADGPFLSPATEDPDEEQAAEDLDAVTGKAYHGKAPAKEYARRVLHALADMKITLDESAELAGFRTEHGITPQVMRAVHWKIFAKHLNTILADGIVDDEELRYLRDLNACLHLCGAGMLE